MGTSEGVKDNAWFGGTFFTYPPSPLTTQTLVIHLGILGLILLTQRLADIDGAEAFAIRTGLETPALAGWFPADGLAMPYMVQAGAAHIAPLELAALCLGPKAERVPARLQLPFDLHNPLPRTATLDTNFRRAGCADWLAD